MKPLYTAHGTATGGRVGSAATDDGKVSVILSSPKEMGGDGGPGTNPEQLFALGYSACFLGAMKAAARKAGKKLPEDATLTADITVLDREDGVGLSIGTALTATVPGWEKADVEALMKAAHDICPYAHLISHAHKTELKVA
jgi:osmotically inducible protein OsmC